MNETWTALALALACGLAYLLVSGGPGFDLKQSTSAHHILMADAMLHGQFAVRQEALQWRFNQLVPEVVAGFDDYCRQAGLTPTAQEREQIMASVATTRAMHDWAVHDDKVYGYWGILTPALMMPFVAVWGLATSSRAINVLFGAIIVALFYVWLYRLDASGLSPMRKWWRVLWTLLFALGTSHFWLSASGDVWFAVQIVSLTPLLLSLIAISSNSDRIWPCAAAGLFFGAAVVGRYVIIALGLFFVGIIWHKCRNRSEMSKTAPMLQRFLLRLVAFGLPVLAAMAVQAWYNHARFGDYRENGLGIQIRTGGDAKYLPDYEKYGTFSLHYLPRNIKYYFWNCEFPRNAAGYHSYDEEGNSILLMTPPLLFMFLAWRCWTVLEASALAGALPLIGLLLFFNGTGWVQFGPRYLLDATPLMLVLAIAGMRRQVTLVSYTLIVLAIGMQFFGILLMYADRLNVPQGAALPIALGVALAAICIGFVGWYRFHWFSDTPHT